MRFASSLALLSLAGLGLAVPASKSPTSTGHDSAAHESATPAPVPQSSDPLSGLLGGIGGLRTRGEDAEEVVADFPGRPARDLAKSKNHGKDKSKISSKDKTKSKSKNKTKSKSKTHKTANKRREPACLAPHDVNTLVDAYVRILSKWNETADAKYLADDFVDRSDSINILAGIPLGSATFPTKAAFIQHENTQPDNLPLVVTHKSPVSCTEIALIWTATFGAAQKPVRGVTILGASYNESCSPGPLWQIRSIDVEFNCIAYLMDIGGSYKLPGQ